jgi:IS66 C-terminal element
VTVISRCLLRRGLDDSEQIPCELPKGFDDESLPDPSSAVPNRAYFHVCVTVPFFVLIGYFLAPLPGLEPYVIGSARQNGLNPELYLRTVPAQIADHPISRIHELLPSNLALTLQTQSCQAA